MKQCIIQIKDIDNLTLEEYDLCLSVVKAFNQQSKANFKKSNEDIYGLNNVIDLDSRIAELDMSIRAYSILRSNDIDFIKDLINKDPTPDGTYGFKGAGKVFAKEIKELFAIFM